VTCHALGDIVAGLLGEALGETPELSFTVGAVSCLGICGSLGFLTINTVTD
jgi:hypothetical protein